MQLTVRRMANEDAWKDIVRIPQPYRKYSDGRHLRRGTICRVAVGNRSRLVIVRGWNTKAAEIQMDLNLRIALKVKKGQIFDIRLQPASWFDYLVFTWKASDPTYRVPAQLSLVSFVLGTALGVLGVILAIIK